MHVLLNCIKDMFIASWYRKYLEFRPFTDNEAWSMFRIVAFGEAVGWTLLIIGIACEKLPVSWNQYPVQMFGTIHGMLFMAYIAVTLSSAPSLNWQGPQTLFAGLCSIPPYGSLLYEQFAAWQRSHRHYTWLTSFIRYNEILSAAK